MTAPALPIELIEHIVTFLDKDLHTLACCALVCTALLPTCRKLLWSDVTIPIAATDLEEDVPQPERQTRFLALIDSNPTISLLVRSLTVQWGLDNGPVPLWKAVPVWEVFPKLRSLTLRCMDMGDVKVLALCRVLSLQTLVLETIWGIFVPPFSGTVAPTDAPHTLKSLRIIDGAFTSSLLCHFADTLYRSGMHTMLDTLDLQWNSVSEEPQPNHDPLSVWSRVITSIGHRLRHLGLSLPHEGMHLTTVVVGLTKANFRALTGYSLANYHETYKVLLSCPNLHSLSIRLHSMPVPYRLDSAFIQALVDFLAQSPPPFPHLQQLSVRWMRELDSSLSNCSEVCEALAAMLAKGEYPSFRLLAVHVQVTDLALHAEPGASRRDEDEALLQVEVDSDREMLLGALKAVTKAGIRLEVTVTPRVGFPEWD